MALATWLIKAYDLNGAPIGTITRAGGRNVGYPLNGIDQLQFWVELDNPMAYQIRTMKTIIKMWRGFSDPKYGKTFTIIPNFPQFGGIVQDTNKQGEANRMTVSVQGILWRIQTRFHLSNHRLITPIKFDPGLPGEETVDMTYFNLMWKVVNLINNAFGLTISNTGLIQGACSDTAVIQRYTIPKGSNPWQHIERLVAEIGAPDLWPVYDHIDNDPQVAFFSGGYPARGLNRDGSGAYAQVRFDYNTGLYNLADAEEREFANPQQFANFIRSFGQGGKHSFSRRDYLPSADEWSMQNVGVYMREDKYDGVLTAEGLAAKGQAALERSGQPILAHVIKCTPTKPPYYHVDYFLGDKVKFSANKGALQVNNVTKRIYSIKLAMSDENEETVELLIADDFTSAVPD